MIELYILKIDLVIQKIIFYTSNTEKSFGTKNKNLNGIVDLYLLSKCNIIYGDVCSSFPING